MSIVLRHGAVLKQKHRRTRSALQSSTAVLTGESEASTEEMVPELDQVEQMIEGVKAHGVCGVFFYLY